ncbi:MAG: hypothetical protein J6B03_12460 [Candidatus Homeothermus sp.]|nr:hypothetical protein [Candidatus Homeothermus sp.]
MLIGFCCHGLLLVGIIKYKSVRVCIGCSTLGMRLWLACFRETSNVEAHAYMYFIKEYITMNIYRCLTPAENM